MLLCIYSCSKKDSGTSSSSSTSGSNPQPTITNFSVNGVAANTPIPSSYTLGGNFIVGATDATYSYPQLQLTFSGNMPPISGPYTIVHTPTSPFYCSFSLITATSSTITPTITSTASSGIVNISATATPNNTASFSNILCTGTGTNTTTYTVSGTIKY